MCPGKVLESMWEVLEKSWIFNRKSPGNLKKCPGKSSNFLEFSKKNLAVTMKLYLQLFLGEVLWTKVWCVYNHPLNAQMEGDSRFKIQDSRNLFHHIKYDNKQINI